MTGLFDALQRQRRAIALVAAGLLVLGAFAAVRLPASILPEVTFPRITVIADSGELPSEAMLRAVTRPLEESIRRVPGVDEVRSTTSRGSAEINLDCTWQTDMNLTLQRVQAQIEAARPELPAGTTLDARLMTPMLFPVIGFSLTSDVQSQARLRDAAIMLVKPELSRLPGVAEVVVQGGRKLEARVTLDPAALQSRGLDAAGVADAIRSSASLTSVGLLEANSQLYMGLTDGRPADLAALAALPIPVNGGATVPLSELGKIQLEEAPEYTRYQAADRAAVLINVLRQPSASAVALSLAAHEWFAANRARLPAGTRVETYYDQSDLVRASAGSVRDALIVGALLAVFVVILFLQSLRLGLAGALVLPGSIAITLIALRLGHQSLNMMTLGGIAAAVGLVLDDAIVVVEHLAERLSAPGGSTRSQAMAELLPSLVGSSLCTLVMFAPFVLLDGVTGAFFRVLALAMALMLAASLLLCITVVPLLVAPTGNGTHATKPHAAADWLKRALATMFRYRWAGLAAAVACVAIAVPLQATLGSGFLPEMDEGSLIMDYNAPPGTALGETDRMLREVERTISAVPEIASWSRRTGDQLGFFITEPNRGDYVLRLRAKRTRSAEEVADGLRAQIEASQPALQIEFGQLVEDVIGDLTSNPQPIEIRVFCEDRALAEAKAQDVASLVSRVRGVVDVKDGVVVSGPNVTLTPAPAAARAGLDASSLARAVEPAIAGVRVGEIVRGARAWDVRVTLPQGSGLNGDAILSALQVPTGPGRRMRLGDLATLRTDPGETEITRDNLRTMVSVTARLSGRDLGSAMHEIQRRLRTELALPASVTVQYGGLWAQQQSSFRGLVAVLLGVVALVLLVLLLAFRSWSAVAAVMLVAAASLLGVFAALHVGQATFNISSFVGAIMTVGIVSENAYFLLAAYRSAVQRGVARAEAAIVASTRRARPILMTTFAGIAALAPLALGIGSGATLLQPLAIAVVGGFCASAVLLLVVLPSLLVTFGVELE